MPRGGGPAAAQYRLHAQDQLARAEGLGDVIVGADLQAQDAVVLVATGGKHDDRHRPLPPHPPAHLQAVHAGEHQVEHDQVGPVRGGAGEGCGAVVRAVDDVTGAVQIPGDDLGDGRIVVDDQDSRGAVEALLVLMGLLHASSLALGRR